MLGGVLFLSEISRKVRGGVLLRGGLILKSVVQCLAHNVIGKRTCVLTGLIFRKAMKNKTGYAEGRGDGSALGSAVGGCVGSQKGKHSFSRKRFWKYV